MKSLAARPRHRRIAERGVTRWGAWFMTARTVRKASGLSGKADARIYQQVTAQLSESHKNDMGKKSGKNKQSGDAAEEGLESSSIHALRRLYGSSQRHVQSERYVLGPWYVVRSDNKQRARLNLIRHPLSLIPYEDEPREKVKLPKRPVSSSEQQNYYPFRFKPELY